MGRSRNHQYQKGMRHGMFQRKWLKISPPPLLLLLNSKWVTILNMAKQLLLAQTGHILSKKTTLHLLKFCFLHLIVKFRILMKQINIEKEKLLLTSKWMHKNSNYNIPSNNTVFPIREIIVCFPKWEIELVWKIRLLC